MRAVIVWRKSSYSGEGDCVEIGWRKSSYSGHEGDCIEVGWRKSSYSGATGECVEVGWRAADVAVRDSKHPSGPTLSFPADHWRAFLKRG